jgi:hypothetical protein
MDPAAPARVREYADQVVEYVRRALGVTLEFDSNTLPLLDHYLRNVPSDQAATLKLVVLTSGAYFGEVVRQRLGGRWETVGEESEWRVVLPTGLNFSPTGLVASAIAQADLEDLDSELDAPARMREYVQDALARMGEVTVEEYYSLCGRLDTIEHVHEVLVAVAAQMLGKAGPDGPDGADDDDAEPTGDAQDEHAAPVPVPDDTSAPIAAAATDDVN